MIPSLPSAVLSDEDANAMIPYQIKRILRHSRPLFVKTALYFVRSRSTQQTDGRIGFICEMIDFLGPILRAIKQVRPEEFELGQLGLLFGGSYGVMEENRNFIDCHYARLREVETLELALGEEGVLLHNGETWVAECGFPPPEDDMLLHLALLSGKENEEAKKFQPLSGPLLKLLDEPSVQTIFDLSSSPQQATCRTLAACMVLASRRDGVRRVNFPEFLGGLLYHLCIRETLEAAELAPELVESGLDQLKMPCLAPLNVKWPRWFLDDLEGSGLKFGEVISHGNNLCDSSGVISAASMEYRGSMSLQDVREALECVPLETAVHLVVTQKLLPLNIDSQAASDQLLPAKLVRANIYSVSRESEMREMAGLEKSGRGYGAAGRSKGNGDGKLVLFIEREV